MKRRKIKRKVHDFILMSTLAIDAVVFFTAAAKIEATCGLDALITCALCIAYFWFFAWNNGWMGKR